MGEASRPTSDGSASRFFNVHYLHVFGAETLVDTRGRSYISGVSVSFMASVKTGNFASITRNRPPASFPQERRPAEAQTSAHKSPGEYPGVPQAAGQPARYRRLSPAVPQKGFKLPDLAYGCRQRVGRRHSIGAGKRAVRLTVSPHPRPWRGIPSAYPPPAAAPWSA